MKCRILLVDDNEAYLDSTKDVLEIEGYDVYTANSGETAVALSSEIDFQVILMDIKMPGMNGVESFIKMKKKNPDVTVIMVSAYSIESLITKAMQEGAKTVLQKPLDFNLLFKTIDTYATQNNGGLILIADDDKDLSDNLTTILTREGYQVITADNGEHGLAHLKETVFDVALIDIKLPVVNGLEVYKYIREKSPDTIAILISGYAAEMKNLIDQALSESAGTFLTKPINIEILLTLIKELQACYDTDH